MNLNELKRYAASKQIALGIVEKDYVLSVALSQFSNSRFANRLIFKGGTAIKKVYFPEARFSEDLDFNFFDISENDLLKEISELFNGKSLLEVNFKDVSEQVIEKDKVLLGLKYTAQMNHLDNIRLDFIFKEPVLTTPNLWTQKNDYDIARRMICEHLNMHTARAPGEDGHVYMKYYCKLGRDAMFGADNHKACVNCKMMAARRGKLFSSAFKAMSLEEILSEKVRACLMRGRPRDLYDIWFLQSKNIRLDPIMIRDKLRLYQEFKEAIPNLKEIRERMELIEPEWERDLKDLVPSRAYPTFQEAIENTINGLKVSDWKD